MAQERQIKCASFNI